MSYGTSNPSRERAALSHSGENSIFQNHFRGQQAHLALEVRWAAKLMKPFSVKQGCGISLRRAAISSGLTGEFSLTSGVISRVIVTGGGSLRALCLAIGWVSDPCSTIAVLPEGASAPCEREKNLFRKSTRFGQGSGEAVFLAKGNRALCGRRR